MPKIDIKQHTEQVPDCTSALVSDKYEMCECGHQGGNSPYSINEHYTHSVLMSLSKFEIEESQQGHGSCSKCNCKIFTWLNYCTSTGKKI